MKRLKKMLGILGPGLITGAADDDPAGIATYTQTGAQFGYRQLWTVFLLLPFITAMQEASARIGAVQGKGLAAVVKRYYSRRVVYLVVVLILVANTINIGADIGAMAAAAELLVPVPFVILTLFFTFLILLLEIFTSYRVYSKILKWLAVTMLAYPITVFMIHQPWHQLLIATFVPHIEFSFAFLFVITGIFGATISPYMFFWQASLEVEEEKSKRLIKSGVPHLPTRFLRNMRWDNVAGMLFSQIAAWSMIVVAATVLHGQNITNVHTAAEAAQALEPLVQTFPYAGTLAKLIFAIGIIGLGLLSIPVLSSSAAYALSEAFSWREGLNQKLRRAHGFYGVITLSTLVGLMINFIGIDPVRALVFSAVINGFVAVPLIFLIIKISSSKKIMGKYKSGWLSKLLLWTTFLGMSGAVGAMVISLVR